MRASYRLVYSDLSSDFAGLHESNRLYNTRAQNITDSVLTLTVCYSKRFMAKSRGRQKMVEPHSNGRRSSRWRWRSEGIARIDRQKPETRAVITLVRSESGLLII